MSDPSRHTWVLHVDLDQFLAAVEIRRRPELAGLPLVVGGDGNPRRPRQVVATASYEARAFGIRSGMPMGQALRRCPEAVFLPSDRPAYDAASAEVMAALRTLPATVEVWGWDEAFLGVNTHDPEAFAHDVKATVEATTALSCAVGIGDTRLLAKTATRAAKPGGVARLTRREWIPTMGAKPVTEIWVSARGLLPGSPTSASSRSRTLPAPITTSSPVTSARRSVHTCARPRAGRRRHPDRRRAACGAWSQQGGDLHHRRHGSGNGRSTRRAARPPGDRRRRG